MTENQNIDRKYPSVSIDHIKYKNVSIMMETNIFEKIRKTVSLHGTVVQDRHFAMNDNPVKDDIAFYFMWKSNIDKNELHYRTKELF